jgi:hypothetical protein
MANEITDLNLPAHTSWIITNDHERKTYSLVAPTASWESIKAHDEDWKLTNIKSDVSLDEILSFLHAIRYA